ncbi:MAG: hypothetical protein K8953_04625, partial [Proteobacteria bacterium]|nr:hypothetical protein [Pseudomonadota bacterium]
TLCTGSATLETVGAVNYSCLNDTTTTVAAARNLYCTTPATTFTDGCATDGSHDGANGMVLAVRKALAETCRDGTSAGCTQPADGLSGKSVAECSANPYDTTDTLSCANNPAFTTERMVRNDLCISSTSEPTSNPFDGLCEVFAGRVAERTAHCGTSQISPWDTKCEDSSLVTETDTRIRDARATICINNEAIVTGSGNDVAAKSSLFNSLCTNLQTTSQTVLQARIDLAATCTSTPADDRCDAIVDATANVTARDCSNNRTVNGDPFQDGCKFSEAFLAQQQERARECTIGDAARMGFCTNAILVNNCIENPHGGGCVDTDAQMARYAFCRGNDADVSDSLCDSLPIAICEATDTPFASTCGPNMMAQTTYCLTTTTADDPLCKGGTVNYTAT